MHEFHCKIENRNFYYRTFEFYHQLQKFVGSGPWFSGIEKISRTKEQN